MKKGIVLFLLFVGIANISAQIDSLDIKLDSLERVLNLKEVTVTAKAPVFVRKTDRLVFNVENSVIATGGDVMEALRITPGLQVKDDKITMIGKSGMSVMVDERLVPLSGESLISYLRSIPTASIKSIEVISMPPAKYDAAGNSGIVNIVLKKARNNSWNMNVRGSYTQATYASGDGGIDFNYKKDKLSIFSTLHHSSGKSLYKMKNIIYYPTETWIIQSPFKNLYHYSSANIGIDYDITDKWKIGGVYYYDLSTGPGRYDTISTNIYNTDNNIIKYMTTNRYGVGNSNFRSGNLHSIHKLDTLGKKVSFDVDFYLNNKFADRYNNGSSLDANHSTITDTYYANRNITDGLATNYSAKIDVELPYKWGNISTGGKLSFSVNDNDYKVYDETTGTALIDNDQTNKFKYTENNQALYLSFSKQLLENLNAQVGLRMENTYTEGYSETINRTDKNNYLQLFPTLYITYKFKNESTLAMSYNRRINRPPFYWLNPFKSYFNATTYYEGNPFLQPSFSNNLDIVFNSNNFEHKAWYSNITDDFMEYNFVNPTTKTTRFYALNFINYYSIGISETYIFNKFWWWNSYNNVVAYYIRKTATIPEALPVLETFSSNISTNNDFAFNKNRTVLLNIGCRYEFPSIQGYGTTDAYYNIYAGIKFRLLNENLNVSFAVDDIFNSENAKHTVVSNGIQYLYNNNNGNPTFRLSASYKFGNKNIRSEQRNVSNQEEKSRIGK